MPLVSVVLPVYNGERFLREAIESILLQSFLDFELIVIDDGSRDGTAAIIRSYADPRIALLQNDINSGIIATLNKGIMQAKGKYICRMDADDIAAPNRIATQVGYLEEHPTAALVGSSVIIIDDEGVERGLQEFPQSHEAIRRTIFIHNPFAHSSVMIRKSVLDEVGGYDARFIHNEDYDLWLRIAARHEVVNLSEPLVKRRIHGESITGTRKTELTNYRLRTLAHAMLTYYRNPLHAVYLIRPAFATLYRRTKERIE